MKWVQWKSRREAVRKKCDERIVLSGGIILEYCMLQYGAAESFHASVYSFTLFPPDPSRGAFVASILGVKFWLSMCDKMYFVGEY